MMNTLDNSVREYHNDVELHAHITLGLAADAAECDADWVYENEIEYRIMLLSEKFLEDADTIETDLRRCIFQLMRPSE